MRFLYSAYISLLGYLGYRSFPFRRTVNENIKAPVMRRIDACDTKKCLSMYITNRRQRRLSQSKFLGQPCTSSASNQRLLDYRPARSCRYKSQDSLSRSRWIDPVVYFVRLDAVLNGYSLRNRCLSATKQERVAST